MNNGGVKFFNDYITFIVDGSEQKCGAAEDLDANISHYSAKKKQPSVNIIIWTSLNGKILHLSSSYGGLYNDDYVMKKEGLLWQNSVNLKENERGFADSGFSGLSPSIVTVPANRNTLYTLVAHFRIEVEQSIEKIKNYGACNETIRMKLGINDEELHTFHHENWTIGAVFVNRYNLGAKK